MRTAEIARQDIEVCVVDPSPSLDESQVVDALRRGDEAAFITLVEQYHTSLLRLARVYVADPAVAEEVVQETWLGVLKGLSRFEGRCSLKSWIFRILTNIARTRGKREHRSISFSRFCAADAGNPEPVVDADRFGPDGHWSVPPEGRPDERVLAGETRAQIAAAVEALPERQKVVITLRDVEGWSAEEVCQVLAVSAVHQRVLLHRARSTVRQALERYLSCDAVVA